jgi:nucleotide-binding universal stress UspA family protein
LLQRPLEILRVVRARQLAGLSQNALAHSAPEIERFIELARATSRYYRGVLAERFVDDRLVIEVGSFHERVAVYAQEMAASVIVLSPDEHRGASVTALARAVARPVLLARPLSRASPTIVAATDLSNKEYPVLRQARVLAGLRGSPIIAVHALAPPWLERAATALWGARSISATPAERESELAAVSRSLELDDALVLREPDAAQAILKQVQTHAADIIVVGTHARPRLIRGMHKSIAAAIIDLGSHSVLVQPLKRS